MQQSRHWQVTASHERCSVSGERHKEIRPRLRQFRRAELHWLDVADRVTFKLGITVHKCLHSHAPDYLSELCTPVAPSRRMIAPLFGQLPPTRRAKNTARTAIGRLPWLV